jgi:hypothetical protein
MAANTRTKLTPPQISARYGCSPEKVVGWIRSGQLRAFNAAARPDGRPRWLVDLADLAAFEQARSAVPVPRTRRRARQAAGVIEFF